MSESDTTPEAASANATPKDTAGATAADIPEPTREGPVLPASLDLNELQALDAAEIEKLCRTFELRVNAGRSRHHLVLDLLRAALGRRIPITTNGFLDIGPDSFGVLRWPR